MKILTPTFLFLSLAFSLLAAEPTDDFVEKFETLKKADDDAAIVKFLNEAAVTEAENPNYYAMAANYWWGVSQSISITPLKEGKVELNLDDLSLVDPKTGKKVGSLGKAGTADPEIPKRALQLLITGAQKFPLRADIAMGLAHLQKEMNLKEDFVATLTTLLSTAKKNPKGLKWMKNAPLPKPAGTYLPESIQAYSTSLFRADSPATDALCGKLLSAITDAFPDHPYAYNLKAALADATDKPEEALRNLEIAHEKAAKDPLILLNLAEFYAKANQKDKAASSYQKALKLKLDPKSRQSAEAALEKLKKE